MPVSFLFNTSVIQYICNTVCTAKAHKLMYAIYPGHQLYQAVRFQSSRAIPKELSVFPILTPSLAHEGLSNQLID